MPRRSTDALQQMIENVDENHVDAHKRLRGDFEELKREMTRGLNALRDDIHTVKSSIEGVKNAPLDATKLMLRTPVVVTLVIMAIGIAAAVWGIRSGMDRIADKMEATSRLQDVQNSALKVSVDEMKRRQEIQQSEIQGMKEMILKQGEARARARVP